MKPEYISEIDWKILKKLYPNNFEDIIEKLNQNYPVQYLIGNVEFLNTTIEVNESILIPRFETEFLVEKTIKKIKNLNLEPCKILDLGTGSGCIAIALKKNLNATITAIDKSKEALSIAKKNARQNQTEIMFIHESIETFNLENYDVIISNPPYVKKEDPVDPKIKYEPSSAIYAEENGLYFYRTILERIGKLTSKPKLIAFEIGMNQNDAILEIAQENLNLMHYSIEKDLTGKNRYIFLELVE